MARSAVRRAAAAFATWASIGAGAAQMPHWYAQIDNDVVYGTDRWYTSGLRIARVAASGGHEIEWGLLQEIYTPEAKRDNPIDRPPAARLLGSFARHDRTPQAWRTLEVDVGVTGPAALGRQAQDIVHRFVPAPHEEWSVQRSNRFDGQLVWARTQQLGREVSGSPDLLTHYGVVLGNQVAFAHAGLELRFGHGAATELSSPALRFAATPPVASAADGSWSWFLGANARAVARNRLLDFQPGSSAPEAERRRIVRRFAGGATWSGRSASVTFAIVHDTREFVGQRRDHGFGSLTVHVPF
jgi:hypothetical protein